MQKLLLLSVVIATLAIPLFAARDANARRGLRRTVVTFALFVAFYVFACLVIYPRL